MNIWAIIIFSLLACFVVYFLIDTVIYCIKKVKARKERKLEQKNKRDIDMNQ